MEGRGIVSNTKRKAGEKEKKIGCLYINTELGWEGKGSRMETGIFRKETAADMYIQGGSAHPESLKIGMIKGEMIRYKAWKRFTMARALRIRGYNKRQIDKTGEGLDYGSRASLIQKRIDTKVQMNVRGKLFPFILLEVAHKPECRSVGKMLKRKIWW